MGLDSLTADQLARVSSDLRLACMRISRRVRYEATHEVAPHQFSVLVRLEKGTTTPGELAEVERVSKPSMTRTVARLVERGLVERGAHPSDGRQVMLTLTPAGRHTLTAIRRQRDAWMASRVARLSPGEQRLLADAEAILSRVANE
ncbi:MAG: MarR family winged helix-turn-helix transcriptional regulator [Dermatophilaceae bacterium]